MERNNICKLIPSEMAERLQITCFVLETDCLVMKQECLLKFHRALLMVEGQGNLQISGKHYELNPGTLVFIFEGERMAADCIEGSRDLYVDFGGSRAKELFHRFDIASYNRRFENLDGLIPLWHESLSRASQLTIDLAAESILLYTFSRLFGNLSEQSSLMSRIMKFSEANFSDPDLSLSSLAEKFGYNAKYISHLFKERMGIGYTEYLRSLRLKYAVSLLEHGIDSVKNVALLSGFSDPLYFSSVFKKTLGVSPKDYGKK